LVELRKLIIVLFRHSFLFVKECLYLLSEQTELLWHYTFNCHLLHVSALFDHYLADFTT